MKKKSLLLISFLLLFLYGYSQSNSLLVDSLHIKSSNSLPAKINFGKKVRFVGEEIYRLKPGIDIPVIVVGTAASVYAFTKIYNKTPPTIEQIQNLKKSDVNSFDRWAIYPYSKSLDKNSYYPFYASIPLPIIVFLTGKNLRNDFLKLTFLYWEAMAITGLLGTSATLNVDRFRPYAYSPETSMDKRTDRIVKNSFYSGHVQVVATPTFFIAQVYSDYYPDSKIKWVFYGVASLATGSTAYMRLKGGEHFPTDILLGTATGVLAGILVPKYHLINTAKSPTMSLMPYSSGNINGLLFTYKFKNK